jgi:hypothetical protein
MVNLNMAIPDFIGAGCESVRAEPGAIIAEPSSPVNRKTRKALRFSGFLYYAPASPVGLLFVNNSITEQLNNGA